MFCAVLDLKLNIDARLLVVTYYDVNVSIRD